MYNTLHVHDSIFHSYEKICYPNHKIADSTPIDTALPGFCDSDPSYKHFSKSIKHPTRIETEKGVM